MTIRTTQLKVTGMQCAGCEQIIEDSLSKLMGIMMANRGLKMTQSGYDFNLLRGHIQPEFNRVNDLK